LGEEQVIALVYPVGTDTGPVVDTIRESLSDVNYTASDPPIHLIGDLASTGYGEEETARLERKRNRDAGFKRAPEYFRDYMLKMDLGDAFRQDAGAGAMGDFAASRIFLSRYSAGLPRQRVNSRQADDLRNAIKQRYAYLIRSLKVPDEITRLRAIYGDALIVIAVNSDEEARRQSLAWKIAQSAKTAKPVEEFQEYADRLIARDQSEGRTEWGQHVSEAFSRADVFVDASHQQRLKDSITRLIAVLFRYRFHTPTRDEYGMFHAYGAGLRSADLSRQVGASILDGDGEIVALGTNDVPKAGGGQYWPDDARDDGRDFRFGRDISTEIKRSALDQFLHTLSTSGHIVPRDLSAADVWDLLDGTQFMDVGEFGRATHAEMGALMHAGRRGRSVQRCTLYTTTFPCHVCARHIVQAGISRVVYNEPYPKSLAQLLHSDSIAIGREPRRHRVLFQPFVGVAPALYSSVFRVPRGSRRAPDGKVVVWDRRKARPIRFADPNSYVLREAFAVNRLSDRLKDRGKSSV
jgi:deoxycytidylate deaminase